jgi:hypothetical protein
LFFSGFPEIAEGLMHLGIEDNLVGIKQLEHCDEAIELFIRGKDLNILKALDC